MTDSLSELAALFRKTGQAHHQAFLETGGVDPEWPLWYADYSYDKMRNLLNAEFAKSDLVYLLITAAQEQAARAPGADWAGFYARFFIEQYPR